MRANAKVFLLKKKRLAAFDFIQTTCFIVDDIFKLYLPCDRTRNFSLALRALTKKSIAKENDLD
jgi:hypothetical protein